MTSYQNNIQKKKKNANNSINYNVVTGLGRRPQKSRSGSADVLVGEWTSPVVGRDRLTRLAAYMGTMTGCFFCPVNSCREETQNLPFI